MTSEPSVTFVIPHKGRENFLRGTLDSIARQDSDLPRDIVVITQNTQLEPATLDAVGAAGATVLHAGSEHTISALRNLGAAQSQAPYLAFLDADIGLSPNWLSAMHSLLESDPAIVLTSAMQICGNNPPPLERVRVALSNAVLDVPLTFLPGRNLLLRRDTFDRVGGFPEHLETCEDYYFTDQVSKLGQLWYSSLASYIHLGEDRQLDEMFHKEIWRGRSNLQSLRGRRAGLRELPSFLVPIWICACLLTGVVLLPTKQLPLALALLVAALLPFGVYVMRLYFLAQKDVSLRAITAFYGYYFPARAWGTLLGVPRALSRNQHGT